MTSNEDKIGPQMSANGQAGLATPLRDSIHEPRPRPPARRKPFIVAASLVVATLVGWAVYHRSQSIATSSGGAATARGQTLPVPVVTVATARKGDIGVFVNALGVVTPLNTVSVSSRVT